MLAYAGYARKAQGGKLVSCSYVFSRWECLALGLMSKPMLVTLPFVLLLIDYWPLRRLRKATSVSLLVEKIPFFILSAASCLVTLIVQKEAEQPLSLFSVSARVSNTLISYVRYISKMFWPFDLATP